MRTFVSKSTICSVYIQQLETIDQTRKYN